MSVELKYRHQEKTYKLMKQYLKKHKRSAHIYPMGGGKSFPPLKYMEEYPGKKVLLVTPNIFLINQFKGYISKYILDEKRVNKNSFPNFRAVTYQKISLTKEIANWKPDVIIFDEIHRMGAENWEPAIDALIAANPDAEIIGMSATPERTDKRNMAYEKFGENVVYEMSLTEALSGSKENEVVLNGARYVKVLSAFREEIELYKEQIDLLKDASKKQKLLKKYEELKAIVSNSPDISDIMKSAMKKKNGKYIVFCSNREEMFEKMNQAQEIFGKVNTNIKMDYVISKKGKTGKTQRENRKTLEEFETREKDDSLNLLFCVDMLNEGMHIEGVDGEIQFKPTNSKIRYKQMVGRVLSADRDADETVIVDAVNNWIRQIDTYKELQGAVRRGNNIKKKEEGEDKQEQDILRITDEEIEFLDVLKEIREELSYHNRNTFDEIIQWLESHDGNMPRGNISKKGKQLNSEALTEDEKYERNLYMRWLRSEEKRILDKYVGVALSEVPEEYRDNIELLRSYGLGLKQKRTYEEIIEWLESHDGKMPLSQKSENNKRVKVQNLTEEEQYEINLYGRWQNSIEYKALRDCVGLSLDNIPEKYKKYKDEIEILRGFGLGLEQKNVYEEIIQWLETHKGKMPQGSKMKNRKQLRVEDLTNEEQDERNLYARWNRSKIREALEACKGIQIDELPEKYSEYKEQIKVLRSYGLGKTSYELLIEWMEEHDGQIPRGIISKNGKRLKAIELSDEEQYERNLYYRMGRLPEYIAYKKTIGIPIDDLPEEFKQYKEQILKLRDLEQMRINRDVLNKMKTSVRRQIKNNDDTRKELFGLVMEVEESRDGKDK